ncbi:LutC/YkgG family protein [Bacillus solimangrovi]|uniref:Lactate utilization protein C n=1 Tax=Bacillus solimangrovi TaxID=1305675 RepID=A0A1E5LEA0_9BACI|nr:lactate utilization protein C [Bacillus solimangrovi]OEH92369.1 lactate utilization protein C [Bacillus solimangrovi]
MTKGTIQNRKSFLRNITKTLGREQRTYVERPTWKHQPQHHVFKGYSQDELVQALKEQCNYIHTDFVQTNKAGVKQAISDVISHYGGKSVVTSDDVRFEEIGLCDYLSTTLPNEEIDVHVWDKNGGKENLGISAKADVGITFSDATLAESGTVVLFSDNGKGRSVSLLPATYIALVPKSTIVPRMTQVAQAVREQVIRGEVVASCVNFISGPSNSADIEMNLIVGVHGPIKATYIVIDDM